MGRDEKETRILAKYLDKSFRTRWLWIITTLMDFISAYPTANIHLWAFLWYLSFESQKNLRDEKGDVFSQQRVGYQSHLLVLQAIRSRIPQSNWVPGLVRAPVLCGLGLAPAKAFGSNIEWCPFQQSRPVCASSEGCVCVSASVRPGDHRRLDAAARLGPLWASPTHGLLPGQPRRCAAGRSLP